MKNLAAVAGWQNILLMLVLLWHADVPAQSEILPQAAVHIPRDIVLVLDNSGSMRKNDSQFLTKSAVEHLLRNADSEVRVGIVVYDTRADLVFPLTAISEAAVAEAIDRLSLLNYRGQHSDVAAALERAVYELKVSGRTSAFKAIVLITDGIIDTGNLRQKMESAMWLRNDLAADAAQNKIAIFSMALGEKADFQLLQILGQKTGGGYYRVARNEDLAETVGRIQAIITRNAASAAPPASISEPAPEKTAVFAEAAPAPPTGPAQEPAPFVEPQKEDSTTTGAATNRQPVFDFHDPWRLVSIAVLGLVAVLAPTILRGIRKPSADAEGRRGARDKEPMLEAVLRDLSGVTGQGEIKLAKPLTWIGRIGGKDNDLVDHVVIDKPTIGRRHALIEYRNCAFWLHDQNSVNGTFINGQRKTGAVRLKYGDVIRVNDVEFKFALPEMETGDSTVASTKLEGNVMPRLYTEKPTVAMRTSGAPVQKYRKGGLNLITATGKLPPASESRDEVTFDPDGPAAQLEEPSRAWDDASLPSADSVKKELERFFRDGTRPK